ncbi:MAG: TnpV protein [Clostridia bacterium]|nr:TnpV protein [Clostridia bacterium]
MKLTYRRCGDYHLPNIGIPAEDMRPLGKYGRMRMRYLREHRSLLFNQLLLSGKLMSHLHSIDAACQERFDLLIPQMKAAEGVTEELKSTDQMEWVRRMNSIHNRIEEILFDELVFS